MSKRENIPGANVQKGKHPRGKCPKRANIPGENVKRANIQKGKCLRDICPKGKTSQGKLEKGKRKRENVLRPDAALTLVRRKARPKPNDK